MLLFDFDRFTYYVWDGLRVRSTPQMRKQMTREISMHALISADKFIGKS